MADNNIKTKETISIVFIGHVDAGKSTLGGHILVMSGNVDQRSLEKYKQESKELNRESWYLSWALDTSQEERQKGITVECGRSTFETAKRIYNILDAPGHRNYVPSMIMGVSYADVAILVISARRGEFETGFDKGGQTREHALLARSLGVAYLVVVINKMDDQTVCWEKDRYDECVRKLTPYLKSLGYIEGSSCSIMPLSGFSGEGIIDAPDKKKCPWYNGPGLLGLLDVIKLDSRNVSAPVIMPISERSKDMGLTVTGKITAGTIVKGGSYCVMPHHKEVEISAIAFDDLEVPQAKAGDIVRLRLKHDDDSIMIGDVLCSAADLPSVASKFEVKMKIIEHKNIICPGYQCVLHMGPVTEEVVISRLSSIIDSKTKKPIPRPIFVKQGQLCVAVIETVNPICVEPVEVSPTLGRFTLRDEGKTIAFGVVTRLPKSTKSK